MTTIATALDDFEHGRVLMVGVFIDQNGASRVWMSDTLATPEQQAWAYRQVLHAAPNLLRMNGESGSA